MVATARGIHTLPNCGLTNEWLTPPEILNHLGTFDLDPCAPAVRPWDTAKNHFSIVDDGFSKPWFGRVWLNPPYGSQAGNWLRKLAEHGNGIALIAARVETEWFHNWVWEFADAALFLRGRLYFRKPDGSRAGGNAGHGSVLVAYGASNADLLNHVSTRSIRGAFVRFSRKGGTQ